MSTESVDVDAQIFRTVPSRGGTDQSEAATFTPLSDGLSQPAPPGSQAYEALQQNGTIGAFLATAGMDNYRLADEQVRAGMAAHFHFENFGEKLTREVAEWRAQNNMDEQRTPTMALRLPMNAAKGAAAGVAGVVGAVRVLAEDYLDREGSLYDPIRGFGAWVQEKATYAAARVDPNSTPDWQHVHGVADAADWLGGKVAYALGYAAPMLAAGATPAGWIGAGAVGVTQGIGQARDALENAGVEGANLRRYTLGAGMVLGALNTALGAKAAGAMSETARLKMAEFVGRRMAISAVARAGESPILGAAGAVAKESIEASAMMAFQDAFTLAAVAAADGEQGEAALDRALAALSDPANLSRIAESSVVGLAFGATLGGPKGLRVAAERRHRKLDAEQRAKEAAAGPDVTEAAREGQKEAPPAEAKPAGGEPPAKPEPIEFEDEPAHELPGQEEAGKGRWREDDAQGGKLVWEPEDAAALQAQAAERARWAAYAESLRRQRSEFERELETLAPEESAAPEAPQFEDLAPLTPEEQALLAERETLTGEHGALKSAVEKLNREDIASETAEYDRLLTGIDAELARHDAEMARRGPMKRRAYEKRNAEAIAELRADREALAADRDAITGRASDAKASEALRRQLAGIGDRLRSLAPQAEEIAARAARLAEIEAAKAEYQKTRRAHEETQKRNETRASVGKWVQRKIDDLGRQIAEAEAKASRPGAEPAEASAPPAETTTEAPQAKEPAPKRRRAPQDRAEADRRYAAELLAALRAVDPERARMIARAMPDASILREGLLPSRRDRALMDELFRALQERAPDRAAEFAERFAAELAGPEPETGPANLSPMPVDEPYHLATAQAIRQGVLDAVDADLSLSPLAQARARRDIMQASAELDAQPYGRTMGEFVDSLRRVVGYELAATGSARAGYAFPVELVTGLRKPGTKKEPARPPTDADFLDYLDAAVRTGELATTVTVYHGLTHGELTLSQLRDGAVVEAPGLIQASPRPQDGAGVVHLRVTLPKGETGFVVDRGRGGVILPAGTMLRIKGIAKQAWRVNPFGEAGRGKGKVRSGLIADAELVPSAEAEAARAERIEAERLAAEKQATDLAAAEVAKRQRVAKTVAEAQKPAEARPDVRSTFYDILESKARLDGEALAKKLGLGDREFRALIDEAVAAGWLLKTDKGKFRRVPSNRRPVRPDVGREATEAARPAETPTPAQPAPQFGTFLDVLKSPHVRKDWAKVMGIGEAELQPMIDDAVAKGWLRRDKRGIVRRNPKGWANASPTETARPPSPEQPAPPAERSARPTEPERPSQPIEQPPAEIAKAIASEVGGLSKTEIAALERAVKARKRGGKSAETSAPSETPTLPGKAGEYLATISAGAQAARQKAVQDLGRDATIKKAQMVAIAEALLGRPLTKKEQTRDGAHLAINAWRPAAAQKEVAPAQRPASVPLSGAGFAGRVIAVASAIGDTRPFHGRTAIAEVHEAYSRIYSDAGTLEQFKRRLVSEARQRRIQVGRLDMPERMERGLRERSEATWDGDRVHFVVDFGVGIQGRGRWTEDTLPGFGPQTFRGPDASVSATHSPAMERALSMVDQLFSLDQAREPTPAFEEAAPEIARDIEARLRRILPPDVAVQVRDRVLLPSGREVSGSYSPAEKLIAVSLQAGPDGALRKGWHEALHALWTSFTDQERALLTERARKVIKDIHPDYDALYRAAAAEHGLDGAEAEAFVRERIDQERVARMAETWEDDKTSFGPKIGALLDRIVNIVKAVGNALRGKGFHTVDDVFQKMFTGEVGQRGPARVDLMGQQASLFGRIRDALRGRGKSVHGVAADAGESAVQEGGGEVGVTADPGARRGGAGSGAGGGPSETGGRGAGGDAQTAAARQGIGGGAVAAGDPSWIRRINDLTFASPAHRERARAMGFDVERPVYHGSPNAGFGEFIRGRMGGAQSRLGPGIYMTSDPHIAGGKPGDSRYSPEGYTESAEGRKSPGVYKLVHRVKNPFDIEKNRVSGDWLPDEYASYVRGKDLSYEEAVSLINLIDKGRVDRPPANRIVRDALRRQGFDGMLDPNDQGSFGKGTARHRTLVAFDPEQVRSITAEFDPERSTSSDLLASLDLDAAALAHKSFPDAPDRRARDGTDAPTTSLREIMTDFRDALGLTVRFGRLDGRLLAAARRAGGTLHGQSSTDTGVIRLRDQRDYDTNAHEAGHQLHDRFATEIDAMLAAHAAEMAPMAASHATAAGSPREQFAEFFRRYMTNPVAAERQAPNFLSDFEQFLDARDPEMFTELQRLQDAYQDWLRMPSASAVRSEIVYHQTRSWWKRFRAQADETSFAQAMSWQLDKIYTYMVDELHPLKVARDRLLKMAREQHGGEVTLKAANDFYKLFRMTKGAYAQGHVDIMEGVRGYRQTDPSGPSLKAALETALGGPGRMKWEQDRIQKFDAYLASRRMVQEYARFAAGELDRPPDKLSLADHQQTIASLEAENPMFARAAQQVYDFLNALLRKQRDAGFVKPEVYAELIQRRDYVPLMRHMEDFGDYAESFSAGRTTAGGRNERGLLKHFKGSNRDVLSPIQSIAQRAYDTNFAVARNDAFRALAKLAESVRGGGEIAEVVPERVGAKDQNEVVHYWEGGKRKALKLHDGELGDMMLDAMTSIGGRMTSLWTELAALPARAVRAGVTISPDFIVSNFVRDQIATWVNTETFTPFGTGARGAFGNLTLNQWSKRYGSFGGISGGAITDELQMRVDRDIQRLQRHGGISMKQAANPLKAYQKILETSESATHIGLFEASYRRARADGMTDYEALVEAAYISRDVLDFDRHGSGMDVWRKIIPFMNASLQGLDRYVRAMSGRENRLTRLRDVAGTVLSEGQAPERSLQRQAWMKSIVPLGLISLAMSALYSDDPEYEEISETIRTTHWLFKAGKDSDGKSVWVRVPKPFEVAWFADVVERGFEYAYKGDQAAMGRALRSIVDLSTPAMNAPAFFLPVELAFNHNMALGGPIVKDEGMPADLQFDPTSSQFAKKVGATLGVAPAYVDHVMGAVGGSIGRSVLGASNWWGPVGPATVDSPFARRFMTDQNRGAQSATEFWALMGRTGGRFTQAAKGYQWMLEKERDPVAAQERLDAMPDDERAYAIMIAHGDARGKQLHPLYRAQTVCSAAGAIAKEINLRGAVDLKAHVKKGETPERVQLSREDARRVIDILKDFQVREYSNALKVLGVPGWAQRQVRPVDGVLEELRAVAPKIAQELHDRLSSKRGQDKTYGFADVAELWPQVRAEVLARGAEANLGQFRP